MQTFCILMATGQPGILPILVPKLESTGCRVIEATDALNALEQARTGRPDLIIADVPLPGTNGTGLFRELRSVSSAPVIIISRPGESLQEIHWFSMGADDYVSRPFNPCELLSRIEAIRRRLTPSSTSAPSTFTFGHVSVDQDMNRLSVNGHEQHLTRMEWQLIRELIRNAGRLMVYETLLVRAWGPQYQHDIKLLAVYMSRLRRKLQTAPEGNPIRNISKTGYILGEPV